MPVLYTGQVGVGGAAEWAAHWLPQARGNKPEDFEPADSSSEKMKGDAEEGRLRSPSYSWSPAWDTLPSAATSQKHESNFGDAPRLRADRIFQWEIRGLDRASSQGPREGRKQNMDTPQAGDFLL